MIAAKPGLPIETTSRGGKGVSVFVQDQITESLNVPFLQDLGTFQVSTATVRDTRTFEAATGHGILLDEILEFTDTSTFMQTRVLNIAVDTPVVGTDTITIDTLFNHSYPTGEDYVRSSDDLRVNGSVTPQIFTIKPQPGQSGDLTRFILSIESTSAMDFTKFGSIAALNVGCLLRVKREGGDYRNLFSFKTNGEFIENSFDYSFQSKTGGGAFGFVARTTYAGQDKRGVVIRVDGDIDEEIQIVINDDLTAGLTKFKVVGQGHEIQGNI